MSADQEKYIQIEDGTSKTFDKQISSAREEPELAEKFGIMSLPSVIGFVGSNPVEKFTGRTKDDFIRWVERLADIGGLLEEEEEE